MLRDDQIVRYSRHVLLPDVGGVGQKRLLAASVEIPDAGGAAAAAIVYLAAAGVGILVVTDAGRVSEGDVGALYEAADVGRRRAEAAADRIAALNPDVRVVATTAATPATTPTAPTPPTAGFRLDLTVPAGTGPIGLLAIGSGAAAALLRAIVSGGPA